MWAAARSHHTGGVNILMADSSVRFITDSVDKENVWHPLATAKNSEVFEMP
ncbi:DUF1559 domain-containing protein [Rhodopirellula bahusiensis]|uniref:DUF1559 family PulG-like putative transporter n=1 Tax=Rhodopirellula bahusiensis TaxID=2014065 RepID=UPI003266486A